MIRKIIHFDLDAFYCAVEEQRHAELKGVPFAVGGRPESRGVVSSCSYAARPLRHPLGDGYGAGRAPVPAAAHPAAGYARVRAGLQAGDGDLCKN